MVVGNIKVHGVIYRIKNKSNNKYYIGQTTRGFEKRYNRKANTSIERVYKYHLSRKDKNEYYNPYLLNAIEKSINEYGNNWIDKWEVIEIYDVAFSQEELNIKEKTYIKIYKSFKGKYDGYNLTEGGEDGSRKDRRSKKIILLNTLEIFNSQTEVCKKYRLDNGALSNQLNGKKGYKSCGTLNNRPMVFMYEDKFKKLNLSSRDIEDLISNSNGERKIRKIICLNTLEIFPTVKSASDAYNLINTNLHKHLKGSLKSCGNLNGEKLVWMYLDDYKK